MAKALKADPAPAEAGPGHNSGKGPNEALFISHLNKLRTQQKKVAEARVAYDAERSALNDLFALAKADKFTRKELVAILDDMTASRRDLLAEEERRAQLRAWAGLPAGTQADLFEKTPSPAVDEIAAEGFGYSAGLRGDDAKLPDHIAPHHAPAFMRGWHAGQEKLAWALSDAGVNPEKKGDVPASAVPLEPEPEDDQTGDIMEAIAESEPEIVEQVIEDHQDEAA